MQSIKQLAGELFLDKVRRARVESPEQKFLDGAQLFDFVCHVMSDGIRNQYPQACDAEIKHRLFERVALARRLESTP
jgi:hypothetical protein